MKYGQVRHPKRKRGVIGPASNKTFGIKVRVSRHGNGYDSTACVGEHGLKTRNGRYINPDKCATTMDKRTPTAAVKSTLHKLARKLK